jgi:hypothetical protein
MEGYPEWRDVSTGEIAMARPQRVEVRSFVLNGDLFDAPFRIKTPARCPEPLCGTIPVGSVLATNERANQ